MRLLYFFDFPETSFKDHNIMPKNFEIYGISVYFINNFGEEILRILVFILFFTLL